MNFYNFLQNEGNNGQEFSPERVVRYREGILKVGDTPKYIVRQIEHNNSSWVFVYEVSSKDYRESKGKVVIKAWHTVEKKITFGKTPLGALANEKKGKTTPKKVVRPYIYSSIIIDGKSTLTDREGPGFFEKFPQTQNQRREEQGRTGVFISLDEIEWEKDFHVDAKSMMKELDNSGKENMYKL